MYAITKNEAILHFRNKAKADVPFEDFWNLRYENGIEEKELFGERLEKVYEGVENLEGDQKEIFIEKYYKGKKIKDISIERGLNENTVKSKLNYARKKIKVIMS